MISLGAVAQSKKKPIRTRPWSSVTKKIAPERLARIQAKVDEKIQSIKPLLLDPALVKQRLRGPNPLIAKNRRLMSVTPATYKKLEAAAGALSKSVGFKIWPLQVAALIVERGV